MAVACANETTGPRTSAAVAVSWMEWPAAVTAVAPGTVRVIGTRSLCGTFQLTVVQSGPSNVGVNALEWRPDPPTPCIERSILAIYDTVVALPRLVTPTGPTGFFAFDALAWSPVGGLARRGFGTITLGLQPSAELRAGGRAYLLSDSLGCSWMRREITGPADAGQVVLSSDVALGPTWVPAFVTGFYATSFSPHCGQTRVFQITTMEVELTP